MLMDITLAEQPWSISQQNEKHNKSLISIEEITVEALSFSQTKANALRLFNNAEWK